MFKTNKYLCSHRSRCKYCGDYPESFKDNVTRYSNDSFKGTDRARFEYLTRFIRYPERYDEEKILRSNSVKGTASSNAAYKANIICHC